MRINKTTIKNKATNIFKSRDGSRSLVRETRIVLLLVFILFFISVFYILYISDDSPLNRNRNNNDQQLGIGAGVPYTTPREVEWKIDLPENYSIKDNDSYETEYFGIYYNDMNKRYYVNIYNGDDYRFDEIKLFIVDNVILKVKDFEDVDRFPNGLITFRDLRDSNIEEFDLDTFEANP